MLYATFLTELERLTGLAREEAERATQATLRTLAERASGGEMRDIAAHLPRELRPLLTEVGEKAEPFDYDEFIDRVARREGTDREVAADHARAVFRVLGMAVAPGELRDLAAQLPKDFEPLLEAAGAGREAAMADDDLTGRIAQAAGLPADQAIRAAEAVLEALATRISEGEVEDLELEVPAPLRRALHRGLKQSREATMMTADEFIDTVAWLEGVSLEEAEQHTRAVFGALRDVISREEFHDMAAQLSRDYEPLLAGAR
jgi:uncharacterized protein (DUF2267 family)